jgi:hypothetical protein
MSDTPKSKTGKPSRIRWVTLGEAVAIAALIVSAAGVWIGWKGASDDKTAKGPATVIERRQAIPLALRGRAQDQGRSLEISPVESSHALQSLTLGLPGGKSVEVGSDGQLSANDLQAALGKSAPDGKGVHKLRVRIDARYVEAGADKRGTGSYVISYRWEGGGLFGGRSLRFAGLSR